MKTFKLDNEHNGVLLVNTFRDKQTCNADLTYSTSWRDFAKVGFVLDRCLTYSVTKGAVSKTYRWINRSECGRFISSFLFDASVRLTEVVRLAIMPSYSIFAAPGGWCLRIQGGCQQCHMLNPVGTELIQISYLRGRSQLKSAFIDLAIRFAIKFEK